VPEFPEKGLAETIWQHYQRGDRRTDAEYLALCDGFVRGVWAALESARRLT
jgi:hypothetical protein